MMRYLQYDMLQEHGLGQFDAWAAAFGETVTAIELAPEGTGFRARTRFARFYNLPELMNLWKEAADIQTADMLKLPVPKAEHINVVTKPSAFQKESVLGLADRAEDVRNRLVPPDKDNMLRITSDGRLLALDQRLFNPLMPDDPESKVNICVKNILQVWKDTVPISGTQLVFSDLSTPHGDGKFNVYDDIREKLIREGIPAEEIAFIHDANTEAQKAELFAKVRKGQVRILLGSTAKMGSGTNVQDRLVALQHMDCPWKPRDLEQREGRILRQGNINKTVKIFRYVTEGTFDAYNWSLIENKQRFIAQVMTGKSPARSCEDVDESSLSYAEVKALATGDPRIKEKMDLDIAVTRLKALRASHLSQQYRLEDSLAKRFPQQIQDTKQNIAALEEDLVHLQKSSPTKSEDFSMKVMGKIYSERKEAGTALIDACRSMKNPNASMTVGEFRGFTMLAWFDAFNHKFMVSLKYTLSYSAELGNDPVGNIVRIGNTLESLSKRLQKDREQLQNILKQEENARKEVGKPFPQEEELKEKSARLIQLNAELTEGDQHGKEVSQEQDSPGLAEKLKAARTSAEQQNTDRENRNPQHIPVR